MELMTALVGRERELQRLLDELSIASPSGGRDSMLIGGDAGVGKTRLLHELAARATAAGWQVVVGHCLDFSDSALPYLPWSEIIGRLTRSQPDVVSAVAADHPALARLQPGRRVLGGPEDEDDGASRAELFAAVHAVAEAAGADHPTMLVVEDLHWADHSTRDLMTFLFSRGFASCVALVASYRADDLHRRHPLRRQLAEWARLPTLQRLMLEPLDAGHARQFIRLLEPEPLSPDDESAIVGRGEGNAFFIEELVDAYHTGDGRLPDDLADLLRMRLERLDERSQHVVRVAAASGRRVDHGLLAAVSGVSGADLDRALRDAVEHHVLVPGPGESYRFRHTLFAEAAYDDLLPGERVALHAAYATALSEQPGTGTAAELARHARLAGDNARALLASLQAGDEASSVGGPDDAAAHYLAALELLHLTPLPDGIDLGLLVARTAGALIAGGHPARAGRVVRRQLDALADDAPALVRGQMLVALADALWLVETDEPLVPLTRQALELIPDDAGAPRARALASHALALARTGEIEQARDAATRALELARRLDLPRLASAAQTTLVGLPGGAPDDDVAAALADAAERAHRVGADITEVRARYLLGVVRSDAGDLRAAQQAYAEAVSTAEAHGAPWSPWAAEARWQHALLHQLSGEWDQALAACEVSALAPPAVYQALFDALRAKILTERGDPAAAPLLATLREHWAADGLLALTAGGVELRAAEHAADQARALRIYDDIVACVSRTWPSQFGAKVRLAAMTLATMASAAATESAAERLAATERVGQLLEDARQVAERRQLARGEWGPEGRAWLASAEAEAQRWRWTAGIDPPDREQLVGVWRQALAAHRAFGDPSETARIEARLAGVLRQVGGDPAEADQLAESARRTAVRLGAGPLLDSLAGSAPPAAARSRETLTPRELEVLRLVASGRTNGEIGTQLYISTKTASVHVSNILAKLEAASRTEAAAIARRDGLID